MRRDIHNSGLLITLTALLLNAVSGYGAEPSPKRSVQLVTFPETGWSPVKVVRGSLPAKSG